MHALAEAALLKDLMLIARRLPHRHWEARVRPAVEALTDALRGAGMPVEAVIIRIKQIARESGLGPAFNSATFVAALTDPRVENAVRWCIARYYVETKPNGVS